MTVVYLNGVNINQYVSEGSLQIDDSIGERSTCQFIVQCPAGTLDVSVGARIAVYTDNKIIFSGTIDSIDKEEIPGSNPPYLQYLVQCADHHQICDRRIVSEAYENMAAGDIVQSLIQNYLASEGIIGNPAEPTFTRPSVAYLTDGTQVPANTPRFEQGRFGKAVMVEEGTMNLLVKNLGTGGSGSIIDISVPNKVWAKRITVEANNFFYFGVISVPTQPNTKYTLTYWARLVSGSVVSGTQIYIRSDSQGTQGVALLNIDAELTSEWKKFVITGQTDANATTLTRAAFRVQTNTGCTVEIADWQLEAKPYATSFIDGTRSPETLTIPTAGVLSPQEGTVECWVKVPIVTKWNNFFYMKGLSNGRFLLYFNSNGLARFDYGPANTGPRIPAGAIEANNWYYIALRWSATTGKQALFVNGFKDEKDLPNGVATSFPATVSIVNNYSAYIDDLRISSIARSDEEILAAYQSGQPLPVDEWTTYKLDFDDNINNSVTPIKNGPTIEQAVFNYVPATKCFDKLADLAGYTWWIDNNKRFHFCDRALYQAPYAIEEHGRIIRPKLSSNRDNYRNRQYIRAGKGVTDTQTETFKGNGVQKTFTVGFPIAKVPVIRVNGVQKTVGIKGIDKGKDWYWNKGDAVITQDEEATPLSDTDILEVVYQGFYDIIALTDDYAEVINRQNIEGGSGIYEAVDEEPYAETSEAAFQSANALLKKYARFGEVLSFETLLTGFRAGQILNVNLPILGAVGEYLIRKVQYTDIQGDKYNYIFSVEAVSCFAAETWTQFFKSNLGQPKTYVIRENIQEQETLVRLVQQLENVGWNEDIENIVFACPIPSENLYPSDELYPC